MSAPKPKDKAEEESQQDINKTRDYRQFRKLLKWVVRHKSQHRRPSTVNRRHWLALVFVYILSAQSQPPSLNRTKTGQNEQQNKASSHDGLMLALTAVIAGAALGQWYIYWRQKQLMRDMPSETTKAANAAVKSAHVAEETLHLTQAADIHLEWININPRGQPLSRDSTVVVCVKNFGATRANQFTNDFKIGTPGGKLTPSDPSNDIAIVVGAGQPMQIWFPPVGKGIDDALFARIMNGELLLKIAGHLRYTDIFEKRCVAKRPTALEITTL